MNTRHLFGFVVVILCAVTLSVSSLANTHTLVNARIGTAVNSFQSAGEIGSDRLEVTGNINPIGCCQPPVRGSTVVLIVTPGCYRCYPLGNQQRTN